MPRQWTLPTWPFHVTSPFRGIYAAPQRPSCRWTAGPRVYQHVRAMWGAQPVLAALSCFDLTNRRDHALRSVRQAYGEAVYVFNRAGEGGVLGLVGGRA